MAAEEQHLSIIVSVCEERSEEISDDLSWSTLRIRPYVASLLPLPTPFLTTPLYKPSIATCFARRSWSGEEYGLLGSTGWAELNFPSIEKAAAYLNVDTVVSGEKLSVSATPALATVWEGVMADVGPSIAFGNGPHGVVLDANVNAPLYADDAIGTLGR